MIYFKVTQTAPDHTGQMDIVENIVSQFDLQEHLINSKGVVNVERVELNAFCLIVFVVKEGHNIFNRHTFFSKEKAIECENSLILTKQVYKKYILQDKL
jgi:hypothetical protein